MKSQKQISILLYFLIVFQLACNATFSVGYPTPTIPVSTATSIPDPTETITATSSPRLSQQVTLVSIPFTEENPGPGFAPYKITAQTPQFTGSDDPRVLAFNELLNDLVTNEVNLWRTSFQQLPLTSLSNGSFLDLTYTLSQVGDIWSFKFDSAFYADTAAHPGLNSRTLNYDLEQGRELTLGELFILDSNYLEIISAYCIVELGKQPFFEEPFTEGAKPTAENYRNWNITPNGILITFDTYQVAPGAAGPQQVLLPYNELKSIVNPQGALAFLAE